MKQYRIISCALIGFSMLLFCSGMTTTGNGGSSETVNAKVYVNDTLAYLASDADDELTLHIYATSYRPYEKSGFTAKCGEAVPVKLPAGTYNFFVHSNSRKRICFIGNVAVSQGVRDTIPCTLGTTVEVTGKIENDDTLTSEAYAVSVQGSPFTSVTDIHRMFNFADVPSGMYTITVRPAVKRLFIATATYTFTVDTIADRKKLKIELP